MNSAELTSPFPLKMGMLKVPTMTNGMLHLLQHDQRLTNILTILCILGGG